MAQVIRSTTMIGEYINQFLYIVVIVKSFHRLFYNIKHNK